MSRYCLATSPSYWPCIRVPLLKNSSVYVSRFQRLQSSIIIVYKCVQSSGVCKLTFRFQYRLLVYTYICYSVNIMQKNTLRCNLKNNLKRILYTLYDNIHFPLTMYTRGRYNIYYLLIRNTFQTHINYIEYSIDFDNIIAKL